MYDMALRGQAKGRVWAYRKAAWTIEDTEQDLGLIYRVMGRKGLESIESVGPCRPQALAQVVEALLQEWM
ncbi:MAG: helix-hairpin-helix domain-containing protein [Anaerolineae bacterium]